jgi:hypothetical protein
MSRRKKWLIGVGAVAVAGIAALMITATVMSKRLEPYVRDQAMRYLRTRFDSEVELGALRIQLPKVSALKLYLTRGRGAVISVAGDRLSLRHKGRRDVPPMFAMRRFSFQVDVHGLFETPKVIPQILLEGLEITIPPPGERPKIGGQKAQPGEPPDSGVLIEEVVVKGAKLTILPKDNRKLPLDFHIHDVRLDSAGNRVAMKYDARLTNARPPGEIESRGTFGPWNAEEPGDTPLAGAYTFKDADLSVFNGIAGKLNSTGSFEGNLSSITALGEARVPDFRLKMSGNRVPLYTRFEVLVDGTNGNTILKPVIARLGSTNFTTSGGVIKHDRDFRRTIKLNVLMPKGNLNDLLRLAMKGTPFMEGRIFLKTTIDIPPLTQKVREKLILNGSFAVSDGKFLRSTIQDQIDGLSRRGQGQPTNEAIDEVVSSMKGSFEMDDQIVTFRSLSFAVPGANVDLAGGYDLDRDALDFHGTLKLKARVSQTMTGWKRWALKPVDPIFAKNGVGTFLRIKIDGTAKQPKFGLDRGKKDAEKRTPEKTSG